MHAEPYLRSRTFVDLVPPTITLHLFIVIAAEIIRPRESLHLDADRRETRAALT